MSVEFKQNFLVEKCRHGWHELLRFCLVSLRYVYLPGVFTELTVMIYFVFSCTFLHFVNISVLSFYIKVIKHIIILHLVYSNMKCPPKLIQAKTRRRNTMDSLYFTELVERSENTTQQESGECMCSCRSWKVAVLQQKFVMQIGRGRVAQLTECIFADEKITRFFFYWNICLVRDDSRFSSYLSFLLVLSISFLSSFALKIEMSFDLH